jgi:hypothetical protein
VAKKNPTAIIVDNLTSKHIEGIMNNKLITALIIGSLSSASMACSKPEKPALPVAEDAVLAQMVKAQKDVKKYIKQSNQFLECVKSNNKHDRMVSEMKAVGKSFNKIVKVYKARSVASS